MVSSRERVGGALLTVGRGAIGVARTLHSHWRRMSDGERERLGPLADEVRERALDLRGAGDREAADRGLRHANRRLADAMVDSAAADPEVPEIEVRRLRDDLARELDRLASADVRASRGSGVSQ